MDPSKLYVEYYAKLHADRAMKLWPFLLQKSERPDFISKRRELGMEVTRAAIEQWAQQEADMNRAFGDEMPGEAIEQSILADCDASGNASNEQSPIFELPQEVKDMHIGRILERIADKTRSLKEYQRCRENWLYIFSETTGLDREDMLRVQVYVDALETQPRFDQILVKVGCLLYVLRQGETLSAVPLGGRTLYRLHLRAKRLSVAESKAQK
ncbi:MAG: hypothetical protein GX417_01860 [Clostridiales bacterium]|nr:hypothetical protein [Clostridiales bacterium]